VAFYKPVKLQEIGRAIRRLQPTTLTSSGPPEDTTERYVVSVADDNAMFATRWSPSLRLTEVPPSLGPHLAIPVEVQAPTQ
jgi:hypothetical protein